MNPKHQTPATAHQFIKTGDPDSYPQIEDNNGEVALSHCRVCGEAESGLAKHCPGRPSSCTL